MTKTYRVLEFTDSITGTTRTIARTSEFATYEDAHEYAKWALEWYGPSELETAVCVAIAQLMPDGKWYTAAFPEARVA